jgi:hypothetical protein
LSFLNDEFVVTEKHSATFSTLLRYVRSELLISIKKNDTASIAWCSLGLTGTKQYQTHTDEARKILNDRYSQLFLDPRSALDPSILDREYLEGLFAGAMAFPSMAFSTLLAENAEKLIDFLEKWAYLGSPSLLGEISFLVNKIGNATKLSEKIEKKVRDQIGEIVSSFPSKGISFANMSPTSVRRLVGLIFGLNDALQFTAQDLDIVRKNCPIEDVAKLCLWGVYNKADEISDSLMGDLDAYVNENFIEEPFNAEFFERLREISSLRSTGSDVVGGQEIQTALSRVEPGFKILPTGELVITEVALGELPALAPKADSLILLSLSKAGRDKVLEFPSSEKLKIAHALRQAKPGFSTVKTKWFDAVAALFLAGYATLSIVALVLLGVENWLGQLWQATVFLLDLQFGSFLDQSLRTLPHPVLIGLVTSYLGLYYSTNLLSMIREKGELSSRDLLACFTKIPIVRQIVSFIHRFWRPTTVRD